MTTKPSIYDFMAPNTPPVAVEKPKVVRREGEEIVNLTFRMPRSRWKHLAELSISDRVSLQSLIMHALEEDFKRRGLRF